MNETLREWCEFWQPPPFPGYDHPDFIQMYEHANRDGNYGIYKEKCKDYIEMPEIRPTTGPTVVTRFAGTKVNNAGLAGGIVALIVIIVLLFFFALIFFIWWKIWRKNKRTGSTGNLPLEVYENTNYLANKAAKGQYWKTSNCMTHDNNGIENMYNSLPSRSNGLSSCDYMEEPDGRVVNGASSSEESKPQAVKKRGGKNGLAPGRNSTEQRPWSQKFEDIKYMDDDPPSPPPDYEQAVNEDIVHDGSSKDSRGFTNGTKNGRDIKGCDDKTVVGKVESRNSAIHDSGLPPIEVTKKSSPKKKRKPLSKKQKQEKDKKNPRT